MKANLDLVEPEEQSRSVVKAQKLSMPSVKDKNKLYWGITAILATFTVIGLLWIFSWSDTFAAAEPAQQKNYAAEEIANLERAKKLKDKDKDQEKLVDEKAVVYVNEAAGKDEEETEAEEVPEDLKDIEPEVMDEPVKEPEPEGEEF